MSNEFAHLTVGAAMTQAEYEAVGGHVCSSQATGDLIYASSAAQLSRLGIGTTGKVLTVVGGVPAWAIPGLLDASAWVVATDAPATLKTYATSLQAAGYPVFVCDGTNDETDIVNACTAAANGKVKLSAGTFTIGAALSVVTGTWIEGEGGGEQVSGTNLNITGTNYGITLTPNHYAMPKLHNVKITTPTLFADTALKLTMNHELWNVAVPILSGINIKAYLAGVFEGSPDMTAGSIGLSINCTKGVCFNRFGPIAVNGYETGMRIYTNRVTTGYVYFNGNQFDLITIMYAKYALKLLATSDGADATSDIGMNNFSHVEIQPKDQGDGGASTYGLWMDANAAGIKWNNFANINIWDWEGATWGISYCIYIPNDNPIASSNHCYKNYLTGFWNATAGKTHYDPVASNIFSRRSP